MVVMATHAVVPVNVTSGGAPCNTVWSVLAPKNRRKKGEEKGKEKEEEKEEDELGEKKRRKKPLI